MTALGFRGPEGPAVAAFPSRALPNMGASRPEIGPPFNVILSKAKNLFYLVL